MKPDTLQSTKSSSGLPYIVCHMLSSLDGHALTDGWDRGFKKKASDLYENLAEQFEFDAWLCGRVTMQEIAHDDGFQCPRNTATEPLPRTSYIAKHGASRYAVSIDPHGKVGWKKPEALDSHIIEVLTESVQDDYLAYLRSVGVSYIFAGKTSIDLDLAISQLAGKFGVKRLVVEGGPHVSGSFVQAGLYNEISVLMLPLIDGRGEHPASFEFSGNSWQMPAYLTLVSAQPQELGAVWLRYKKSK